VLGAPPLAAGAKIGALFIIPALEIGDRCRIAAIAPTQNLYSTTIPRQNPSRAALPMKSLVSTPRLAPETDVVVLTRAFERIPRSDPTHSLPSKSTHAAAAARATRHRPPQTRLICRSASRRT
jgi:hypothetical protein